MPDLWLTAPGPDCPQKCGPLGTPIRYPWGEPTTDRWLGPDNASVWCPCCGHGWVATPAEVAQANASLRAYEEANGHPWPDEYRLPARARQDVVDTGQLDLFVEVERGPSNP